MDMKSLLEKMMKFAGGADQQSGPAGQLRGGSKMPKKGGKHPAYHKLVGDSVEPEGNMLGELANEAKAKSLEWSLAEAWAEFKEEAFKDTAERRPARKGSRPSRGHEPVPGYKKVGEGDCIDKEKITKFHKKLDTLVHSTFGKRKDEMEESVESNLQPGTPIMVWLGPPSNNPPRDDKQHWTKGVVVDSPELVGREWRVIVKTDAFGQNTISPDRVFVMNNSVNENAEELNVGDDVIITGPVEHKGETGVIDSFGKDKSFVVVNLYNHGKKSFHSSDVSFNDYADSDAEEAEMYDRDPDFRDWAARQDVAEGKLWRVAYSVEDERYGTAYDDKVFDNPGEAQRHVYNIKRAAELAGQEVPVIGYQWFHPEEIDEGADTPLRDREDYEAKRKALQDIQMDPHTAQDSELSAEVVRRLAGLEQQRSDLGIDESRAHKILARKLADIERKPSVPSADDDAHRAEQAKADYAKYVAKMKKKDPNYTPLYKMDEYGAAGTSSAAQTTSTSTTPTATASPEEKQKAAKMTQAATTMKSAIGTTAPTTSVVKALDTATQGKTVGSQDMKILEPMMKDMATVAQEPRLANQFKTLVNQINQTQRQQAK